MSYTPPSERNPYEYGHSLSNSQGDLMHSVNRHMADIDRSMQPDPALEYRKAQHKDQFQEGLMRLIVVCWLAFPTAMAAKAGTNWHALTGDRGASVERGAQALVRWARFQWMFLATFIPSALFALSGGTTENLEPIYPHLFGTAAWIGLAWVALMWGVIYCRMAEFSLFKRGPIQSLLTPVVRLLDGVHTWAIGLAAWLPVLLLGYMLLAPTTPNV